MKSARTVFEYVEEELRARGLRLSDGGGAVVVPRLAPKAIEIAETLVLGAAVVGLGAVLLAAGATLIVIEEFEERFG